MHEPGLGFAGKLCRVFIGSKLTPVLAILSLLLGFMAVYFTPKEEEPQISVPMIDIQSTVSGFSAKDAELSVTQPIEQAMWGLEGVEYIYSSSQANHSLVTVRFKVGESMESSLVKIHHKLLDIQTRLPSQVHPEVHSYSIDEVPFLVLTFTSTQLDDEALRTAVAGLSRELVSTPDLARVELLGGRKHTVRVIADPVKLAAEGVSLLELQQALQANNALGFAGKNWSERHHVFDVDVGVRAHSVSDIAHIAVGQRAGHVVLVKAVAEVHEGPEERVRHSVLLKKGEVPSSAVSLVFAKRKGTNVVSLSKTLIDRVNLYLKDTPSLHELSMTVVRDYGQTAGEKSDELIEHLLLATLSVTVLIALFMGIRAALVVAIAIPVTLALTLAVYYFMGYTLNRVTLFALIFSIGILVDDAIVVVENISRHLKKTGSGLVKATIAAVNEVGNPTILATFTVIAAILPMAFVRGLMGPYMKPIPVGASLAMLLSLFVAFMVTPWVAVKLLKPTVTTESARKGRLGDVYEKLMGVFLGSKRASYGFAMFTLVLFMVASALVYFKVVKVKMLPFDNKTEFQVLIDYPSTTPLRQTTEWSSALAAQLVKQADVTATQVFAGEAAPFSFSGMVKHTYLRQADYQSDLQVVLTNKSQRKVASHEIVEKLRPLIKQFAFEKKAVIKVLEIPPGPPVLATLLAEVYGPDTLTRERVTRDVEKIFAQEPSVVDLDTSLRLARPRLWYRYKSYEGGRLGTSASELLHLGQLMFSESPLYPVSGVNGPEPVDITLSMSQGARASTTPFAHLTLRSATAGSVEAEQLLHLPIQESTETLHRKNLKPVSYVMSELSGAEESPVYGILKLAPKLNYLQQTAEVPWNTLTPVIKWDGEWFITYEVFRDLGVAFAVVLVLIFVLIFSWFESFTIPWVIMVPIPLSLIGILPGHALWGAYFTATSMIGFIAGAGIIVRNSIILVDFIEHQLRLGTPLKDAVLSAGVLRFRPMLLTAAAVVVGSSVMLSDPIFQGLALSLMFGEVAATLLSRFAVPILYFWFIGQARQKEMGI
jgi:multidrug efflux pump subunit AcrB